MWICLKTTFWIKMIYLRKERYVSVSVHALLNSTDPRTIRPTRILFYDCSRYYKYPLNKNKLLIVCRFRPITIQCGYYVRDPIEQVLVSVHLPVILLFSNFFVEEWGRILHIFKGRLCLVAKVKNVLFVLRSVIYEITCLLIWLLRVHCSRNLFLVLHQHIY